MIFLVVRGETTTFADMKIKINWKQFAAFFIVIGCTYYITRNFFMTAGILMLLLLIDANRRRRS